MVEPEKKAAAKKVPAQRPAAATKQGGVILVGDSVRVWSEIGVTLPIGDTTAHIRFSFGHERVAKNSTQAEIARTSDLVDEFNEKELDKRLTKHVRTIKRVLNEEQKAPKAKKKESVRDRALRKAKKGKK